MCPVEKYLLIFRGGNFFFVLQQPGCTRGRRTAILNFCHYLPSLDETMLQPQFLCLTISSHFVWAKRKSDPNRKFQRGLIQLNNPFCRTQKALSSPVSMLFWVSIWKVPATHHSQSLKRSIQNSFFLHAKIFQRRTKADRLRTTLTDYLDHNNIYSVLCDGHTCLLAPQSTESEKSLRIWGQQLLGPFDSWGTY